MVFDRTAGHRSQPRSVVHEGALSADQLTEGVPVFSKTDHGVVQYVKIGGIVYQNILYKAEGEAGGIVNKNDHGYVKLPGGILMQWGVVGKPDHGGGGYLSTTAKVVFPIPFPEKVLSCTATIITTADNTNGFGDYSVTINEGGSAVWAINSFGQIAMRDPVRKNSVTFSTPDAADAFFWMAVGF